MNSKVEHIIDGLRTLVKDGFKSSSTFSVDVSFSFSEVNKDEFDYIVKHCHYFKKAINSEVEITAQEIPLLSKFQLIIRVSD